MFTSEIEPNRVRSSRELHEMAMPLTWCNPQWVLEEFRGEAYLLCESRNVGYSQTHSGNGGVLAESRWISRVLHNLLVNSVSSLKNGSTVRLDSTIDASNWRVVIDREGGGKQSNSRDERVERLFRLPQRGQHPGGGLALALCKSIITLHEGQIWAEPLPDSEGSRVVFTIPACG